MSEMPTGKVKIGLVDDDKLVLSLLGEFVQNQAALDLLFTASGGAECLEKIEALDTLPDILILDLKMKPMNGIETMEKVRKNFETIKVVVLSSHYKDSFTGFMLKTGASAFIPKGLAPPKLVDIICEVHDKGYYFMKEQFEIMRDQLPAKTPKELLDNKSILTSREIEVLDLICQQKTAKEIGEKLFITPRTAEGHKNNLFIKTGARNIAGLAIYAIKEGLISPDQLISLN